MPLPESQKRQFDLYAKKARADFEKKWTQMDAAAVARWWAKWCVDGKKALFYQFAGQSSSGLEPDGSPENWRCVFVEQLQNVQITDAEWHTAPNHSRPQTCVDEIVAEYEP